MDDSKTCLETVVNALKKSNLFFHSNIISFSESLKAYDYLKNNPPHILLSDYSMPNLDGNFLCKSIKELYPQTKIILFSCSNVKNICQIQEKAKGIVDVFLDKKPEIDLLVKHIKDFCAEIFS